ncbi:MAG: fimbrillin family protein [Parabacteroides sp.]
MRRLLAYFCSMGLMLFSCDNTLEDGSLLHLEENNLSISVITDPVTKGLITSTYLPTSSKIGVFVTNTSGGDYDGHSYKNIAFTANGSDANQTWNGSSIALSMNVGKCYAYYPYSSSVTDMTNIPVSTSGQDDYMYATAATVNANNTTASLKMKHALSAVRFMIKKGTYAGAGQVTAVSVRSSALGTSGALNAVTGEVTGVSGKGSTISVSKSLKLSTSTQDVDVIVVPTGSASDLTLSVTLDGTTYSTVVSGAAVTKANCNKYTLTVNAGGLALSGVEIGDWGYNDSGAPTITAGSYKVTFAGNYSDIAFGNSVSGSTVTIKAVNYDGYFVNDVSVSSGATITQSVSGNTRVITLANIKSNVTVTFNGVLAPPAAIADDWSSLADGVYAVRPDLKPANAADGNELCIGVGLVNSATGQKLMIEKHETSNSSYATAASGKSSKSTFYWGGYGTDQSIANYTSSSSALTDYNGKANSEVLKTVTTGGSSYTSYATIGAVLNQFINTDTDNQGYTDWYIPVCGQLYLIYQNMTNINTALSAIGGTQLTAVRYWSSCEYSANSGWYVNLNSGDVGGYYKYNYYRVRLVRDLF